MVAGDDVAPNEFLQVVLCATLLKSGKLSTMLDIDAVEDQQHLSGLDPAFGGAGQLTLVPPSLGINITHALHVTSGFLVFLSPIGTISFAFPEPQETCLGKRW